MSCGYQGYEFGAAYLDSICVEGRLFDADDCDNSGNLYEPVEDIPCPICHRQAAIDYYVNKWHGLDGTTKKQALKTARALVRDIRQNRGLKL